jgi:hypothetical protein
MKNINIKNMTEDNNMAVRSGAAVKIIAAAAAALMLIGVPAALRLADKTDRQTETAPLAAQNAVADTAADKEEETAPAVYEKSTADAAVAEASAESGETAGKVTKKSKSKKKKANKTEQKAETAAQEIKLPETVIPTDNSPKYPQPAVIAQPETVQTVNTDTFVDKMLTMNSAQLRALSNNEYEVVSSAHTQSAQFGIKCSSFPDYVFVPEQYNEFCDLYSESADSVIVPVTYPDGTSFNMSLGNNIKQLELYGNAQIGNGAYVGMTYNDLAYVLEQNLYIEGIPTSLDMAAAAKIEGRTWLLHFSLTEAQQQEVISRIRANDVITTFEDGTQLTEQFGSADISDINPVCDLAVLVLDR